MCGNGGRCVVAFARQLEIIKENCSFTAIDGLHKATISPEGIVNLQMNDVDKIEKHRKYVILNTGSPHHVELRKDIDNIDIKKEGAKIRYAHSIEGINVNFVEEINENTFKIRTYERGVEDETYSCGTGATAVAIAMHKLGKTQQNSVNLQTKGGDLQINFEVKNKLLGLKKSYENVWLCGMVKLIYKGDILCDY